jgi:hypothetical protein
MRRSEPLKIEWPKLSACTTIPPVLSTATFISATPTWQLQQQQPSLLVPRLEMKPMKGNKKPNRKGGKDNKKTETHKNTNKKKKTNIKRQ